MPRIRSIKPDFFTSETVAKLTFRQMILFAGLWVYCDDHGRGRDDPRLIKAVVWPQRDDVSVNDVAEDLRDLNVSGFIARYEKNGSKVLAIPTWKSHQRVTHPAKSKYPAPPRVSRDSQESLFSPPESLVPEVEVGSGSRNGNREREQGTGKHLAPARPARDEIFDALVELFGSPPQDKNLRGNWNVAAKELRAQGATPAEIRARFTRYRLDMPNVRCTPMALAKHWGSYASDVPATQDVHPLDAHLAKQRLAGGHQ